MASSSSSAVMASSDAKACSYDVFLSFSGEDTRNSFTDHLYLGLKRAGIHTFRDNEGINKGEELKPEFKEAIKKSRASVVVLSKNYATSTWCLDELLLILQQRKECNHFVLPVFFGVDPTDIRNQKGNFAIKVKPSSKWTDDNVNKWKTALMQIADLAGHVLSGPETSFLKDIINTVYKKLGCKRVYLPPDITGMASHDKEINSWFQQCNPEFFVIYGMGGSGKTTLAKYIYDSYIEKFLCVSFLEDIDRKCKRSDLIELQQQLLNDISGGKWRKIPSVSQGTPMIEDVLEINRALIVLDDIAEREQLVALLGTGKINAQSKIIITTRENTENWFDFPYWRCRKYEMTSLNDVESSQLLCYHAFGSKTPMVGFEDFVLQAVRYCEGNPLALKVLGSSLSDDKTIASWRSQLRLLEKDMHVKIKVVLQKSYKSLPFEYVKMLFLHIACFFVGKDMDYVVKILEPDYSAILGIKILINRCLLSVSPNKELTMHRLLQEMGKNIVCQESKLPANRSRVWLSRDSYKILRKGTGSETIQGLALDMKMLSEEDISLKSSTSLRTDALNNMDMLKFLQLNFVELNGSYENFSEDLRWLCWLGCHLKTIPPNLYIRNLVAIDMSYSKLEIFDPPMVLQSLRILNLKDSHNLTDIRNIFNIPHLETLILWNCCSLVNVCNTLGDLKGLELLNMTGCNALTKPTFPLPSSLRRLFLKDCHLECTDSFPLSFSVQLNLQYLNLGNSLFESLPCYSHLENLRILDLSFCSRLKCLICLPSTLAELYIYGCELLERITFQSSQFTLLEFGYLGCIHLYEVEGYIKLVPIAKLSEIDLGHMKWLQHYQYYEVCLLGDDELIVDRSWHIQMLYEFNIMSTSLPDIWDPNMTPEHISKSASLSFDVPGCPKNKILIGINVTFKYVISSDDCAWFCKISMSNGVSDLLYNPKVFGKPELGKSCIWLSYWPIGHTLKIGDRVNVSIVVLNGLDVHECGVSLVYSDKEILENNLECAEILGGDLSGFHLSTGAYYLCRRDFLELVEVGRLNPDWFRILAGDTIDYTEIRGWRKTGRPKHMNPSSTEVKTVRCILHGPQLEEIYIMAKMSKSSIGDKTVAFTSSLLEGETKSGTISEVIDETMEMHLQKAQQIILRWDSTVSKDARARMIFQGDFQDIDDYLQAVDEIQRFLELTNDDEQLKENNIIIQIAMARLEYEFRHILISHATPIETESISSIQLTSKRDTSFLSEFHHTGDHTSLGSSLFSDTDDHTRVGSSRFSEFSDMVENTRVGSSVFSEFPDTDDHTRVGISLFSEFPDTDDHISLGGLQQGESSTTMATYSIREIDLIPFDSIYDLRSITRRMSTARYLHECIQVYVSVRKSAIDASFEQLGIEKLSIGDIQRLEWEAQRVKIEKWIHAARVCIIVLFASEKRLFNLIFEDLGTDVDDACFMETVKAPAIQLFNFAEAISISHMSQEKLFKILDLHEALLDLLPDIEAIFYSKSSETIRVQATEILSRLAEAARGMLSEFENAVLREPSKVLVPGGTIHPLTRYVMNYISLISDYKRTLGELIVSRPATGSRYSPDDLTTPDMDFAHHEGRSPLALHLIWIIIILQFKLEEKSKRYKDNSLAYVFIVNNIHYIVQKIRESPELREMIGDDYLKKLIVKLRQAATQYERATWVSVFYCLKEERVYTSGSSSSGVSKSALREQFKSFNKMFEEVHRTQALWLIPDSQLREELQTSISHTLIPAYRSFLERFRTHIEQGHHPEKYIKYSVEDLETAVLDFFHGNAVHQHS